MRQSIAIQKPRRGFHEKWSLESQRYGDSFIGGAIFVNERGEMLVIEREGEWVLPTHPVNGRDAAPIRIPRTIASRELGIDPEEIEPIALVCECDANDRLVVVVKAKLPRRLCPPGERVQWLRSDDCLKRLRAANSLLSDVVVFARTSHSLKWASESSPALQ